MASDLSPRMDAVRPGLHEPAERYRILRQNLARVCEVASEAGPDWAKLATSLRTQARRDIAVAGQCGSQVANAKADELARTVGEVASLLARLDAASAAAGQSVRMVAGLSE